MNIPCKKYLELTQVYASYMNMHYIGPRTFQIYSRDMKWLQDFYKLNHAKRILSFINKGHCTLQNGCVQDTSQDVWWSHSLGYRSAQYMEIFLTPAL